MRVSSSMQPCNALNQSSWNGETSCYKTSEQTINTPPWNERITPDHVLSLPCKEHQQAGNNEETYCSNVNLAFPPFGLGVSAILAGLLHSSRIVGNTEVWPVVTIRTRRMRNQCRGWHRSRYDPWLGGQMTPHSWLGRRSPDTCSHDVRISVLRVYLKDARALCDASFQYLPSLARKL